MRKGTVEIDKDELYKKLVYLAWFIHMEKEIKYLNTIRHLEEFENFKKILILTSEIVSVNL